ncbi:hypothetical protein LX69_02542 [Breznakibacter xylanolyticus]|uniref:Antitoxin n=1 Tax=Breznakibacter xylanolyticus TaxID=990 RepID=A0A2W7N9Z8_9BACT|nr:hypothetical protein LX69_02542 [Breznakibacter xylanolyticus]
MTTLTITDTTIEKYFSFLNKLDNNSKKRLIMKLSESLHKREHSSFNIENIYGAWEDTRDSDEIIKEIQETRINQPDTETFE